MSAQEQIDMVGRILEERDQLRTEVQVLRAYLEGARKALRAIMLPDFVIKNDVQHAYNVLRLKMKLAQDADSLLSEVR